MKQITLILGDGYDSAISVTAIGSGLFGCVTYVSTAACEVNDGDKLYISKEIKLLHDEETEK